MWFSLNPHAWQRISEFDSSGTGRTALWTVAWRITEDHPVNGVGLDNFVEQAPKYTREPGKLELVHNIAEKPHVAHNVYLQFLAETGFIGAILFDPPAPWVRARGMACRAAVRPEKRTATWRPWRAAAWWG